MKTRRKKTRSLKQRLMLFAVWTTAPAVFVCWCAQAVHEWYETHGALPRILATRAQIIGRNTAAALTFRDAKDAAATLETLRADPFVLAAYVLSAEGKRFAAYHASGADHTVTLPSPPVGEYRFEGDCLLVREPILLDGERIGSIYLQYGLHQFYVDFWRNTAMFATVAVLAMVFALILARTFRRSLADPMLELATTAAHVAREKDYGVRAVVQADDELGALTRAFNGMLDEIQDRDADLRAINDTLELRVVERTSALAESEDQIHALVRDVNGIVWEADAKTWQFTFVSDRAEAILGYPVDRWLSEPDFWVSILHPDDRDWVVTHCREASADGEDHEFEYRSVAADGRIVWLRDLVRPVRGESGVEKLRGLMVDISEQKRNEAFRVEHNRVLETLASDRALPEVLTAVVRFVEAFAPDGRCAVFVLDDDRRLRIAAAPNLPEEVCRAMDGLLIGPAAASCGTAAYRRERVIVQDAATDPLWEDFRDVAQRNALRACWSEPILSADGCVLGTLAMCYSQPRRPDSGELRLIETVAHIARLALERARGEADRRRLGLAVEAAGDAVVVTDAEGVIQYANPAFCRITGYGIDESRGKKTSVLKSGTHDQEFYSRMWETILAGRTWSGRITNRRKDGSLYPAALTVSPVTDRDAHVAGFVGVHRDVTLDMERERALAEARDEAEAANRTKSEFLANMSHEIRTPMNGIIGMTELALGTDLNDVQREYLGTVRDCADSLLVLLNDILDLSKIEAGKLELETTDFDLVQAIEGVLDLVGHRAARKGLELIGDLPPKLPRFLRGDPLRLRQVLINLAGNAMKFTESGEVVVGVHVERVDDGEVSLRFAVSDTGIGIPADRLDRIFETFSQADGATTRRYGGTGLGLAISRRIVALMGGRIEVQSEVGVGSVFSFSVTLPLGRPVGRAVPDMDCADDVLSGKARPAALAGKRILVVDDNATNRRVLAGLLRSWSSLPEIEPDGLGAIGALRRAGAAGTPIDIVLLDVQMPGMDGFETLRRISADPTCPRPVIVLLSSLGGDLSIAPEGDQLADACIVKPIKQAQLAAVLTSLIRGDRPGGTRTEETGTDAMPQTEEVTRHEVTRVLLVEDNPVNRRVASVMLARIGCAMSEAENGRIAIDLLEREAFDLVFMDVQMPVLDGYETTARIRDDDRWKTLPIIAMTAHAMRGDRERCIAAGMNDYVSKPITLDALRTVIDRWVRRGAPSSDAGEGWGTDETLDSAPGPSVPPACSAEMGHTPSAPPEPCTASPIDIEEALTQLGGDRELLGEVLDLLVGQMPQLVAECRAACAEGDMDRLRRAAHAIKGTTGNVRAGAAYEAAIELERAAERNDADSVRALIAAMERHTQRLREFTASFSAGDKGA